MTPSISKETLHKNKQEGSTMNCSTKALKGNSRTKSKKLQTIKRENIFDHESIFDHLHDDAKKITRHV